MSLSIRQVLRRLRSLPQDMDDSHDQVLRAHQARMRRYGVMSRAMAAGSTLQVRDEEGRHQAGGPARRQMTGSSQKLTELQKGILKDLDGLEMLITDFSRWEALGMQSPPGKPEDAPQDRAALSRLMHDD
jgi:hypothetical protein